jgi:epsin
MHLVNLLEKHSIFVILSIECLQEVEWGGLSMLDAERRLLANALLDPNNERFVLLSESCIPISNFSWAYEYITKSQHSFVDCYDDVGRVGKGRYLRIQHPGRLEPEVSLNEWRKGSQWFEMSRELAMIVVSDTKYYPKFKDILCQHEPCFIDEHYLPSVLNILKPSKLANRTLTYFVFPKHGYAPHPIQWKPEMITQEWIQTLKGQNCTYNGHREYTNCHLFARKFSPETLEPLLKLAPNIYGIN